LGSGSPYCFGVPAWGMERKEVRIEAGKRGLGNRGEQGGGHGGKGGRKGRMGRQDGKGGWQGERGGGRGRHNSPVLGRGPSGEERGSGRGRLGLQRPLFLSRFGGRGMAAAPAAGSGRWFARSGKGGVLA